MPVLQRGTQAEVGITGLFWIRLSSGPVFHSKSGSLCHPAHWGVMLSQQDILPPLHHPHPASTRHPLHSQKGHKSHLLPQLSRRKILARSLILIWYHCKCCHDIATGNPASRVWSYLFLTRQTTFCLVTFFCLFFSHHVFLTFGFYVQKLLEQMGDLHIYNTDYL